MKWFQKVYIYCIPYIIKNLTKLEYDYYTFLFKNGILLNQKNNFSIYYYHLYLDFIKNSDNKTILNTIKSYHKNKSKQIMFIIMIEELLNET